MSALRRKEARLLKTRQLKTWLSPQHVLPIAKRLVPAAQREDWLREWQAELWYLADRPQSLRELASLAYGIVVDAACLRVEALRDKARASAYTCLWILAAYSLFCAAAEWFTLGSWHSAVATAATHFLGLFVWVAAPALIASVATNPIRALRSHAQDLPGVGRLSIRAKWNLFLAAKIALTLALAFLVSLVAVGPLSTMIGRPSDWVEVALYAITVNGGIRWALLNQEQRCQRCLRMLTQPTRVGPPSRNFLDWSGMEQACADGHGLLHTPEMQGSWCWYDLWLDQNLDRNFELDATSLQS
jgi:hypothetical protein